MLAAFSPTFPREAVDHVVTYDSWHEGRPHDRVFLARHGALVRKETRSAGPRLESESHGALVYANIATGAWIDVSTDAAGDLPDVRFWKGASDHQHRSGAHRTGRTESIAGERCTVWRSEIKLEIGSLGFSACITRDGVVLRDTKYWTDGSIEEQQRAIKVERRAVDPSEVLPPREALDWAHWSEFHDARAARSDLPANYELVLSSKDDPSAYEVGTMTYRTVGGWSARDSCSPAGGRELVLAGTATNLHYYAERGGAVQLSLSRSRKVSNPDPSNLGDPYPLPSAPLSRPPEMILGQPCAWVDAAVGASDYIRRECRTRDNLPLIIAESSWGAGTTWKAVALRRGRTPVGSVRPPAWLMDWAYWGWPQLAGHSR